MGVAFLSKSSLMKLAEVTVHSDQLVGRALDLSSVVRTGKSEGRVVHRQHLAILIVGTKWAKQNMFVFKYKFLSTD